MLQSTADDGESVAKLSAGEVPADAVTNGDDTAAAPTRVLASGRPGESMQEVSEEAF